MDVICAVEKSSQRVSGVYVKSLPVMLGQRQNYWRLMRRRQ